METNRIYLNGKEERIGEALAEAERFAEYNGLSEKNARRLRLLTEELIGMVRGITGDFTAVFWVEGTDSVCHLHLLAKTEMNFDKREDLLSAFCERYGKEWKEYVSKLIANEQRMLSAREFSKEDAAKELIRKMWIHRYQQQQRELPLDADTPNDILEKRLRLSCIIKDLQTKPWEVIEKILRVATGKDESEANDTQPLNSTHTTPAVYPSTVPPPHDAEAHETSAFDNQPVEEAPSEFLPDDDLPPDLQ